MAVLVSPLVLLLNKALTNPTTLPTMNTLQSYAVLRGGFFQLSGPERVLENALFRLIFSVSRTGQITQQDLHSFNAAWTTILPCIPEAIHRDLIPPLDDTDDEEAGGVTQHPPPVMNRQSRPLHSSSSGKSPLPTAASTSTAGTARPPQRSSSPSVPSTARSKARQIPLSTRRRTTPPSLRPRRQDNSPAGQEHGGGGEDRMVAFYIPNLSDIEDWPELDIPNVSSHSNPIPASRTQKVCLSSSWSLLVFSCSNPDIERV
jgi:hypothetical protein